MTYLIWWIFFPIFIILHVLKFWLNQTYGWKCMRECMCEASSKPKIIHRTFYFLFSRVCDARLRDKSRKGTFFRTLWIYTGFPHSSAVWHHRVGWPDVQLLSWVCAAVLLLVQMVLFFFSFRKKMCTCGRVWS